MGAAGEAEVCKEDKSAKKDDKSKKEDKTKNAEFSRHAMAVLGIGLVAMNEDVGAEMAQRVQKVRKQTNLNQFSKIYQNFRFFIF